MKFTKRLVGALLSAAIILTGLPAAAYETPENAAEPLKNGYSFTPDQYEIYPVPQNCSYPGGSFELETNVNVISEDGIDNYTNAFLSEILTNYNRNETKASQIGSGSQILLGIKGSKNAVDAWASDNLSIEDDALFEKTDSYLLSAQNGTIVILGKDTNAVFYGLATLQMMFSSFNASKFPNVQIEDYAVMNMRGFIEGFYGGWDYEGRESLMRFARDIKMNTYIYASKADSYHKNDASYPPDEINKIKNLVKIGNETKVEYCWSIHISFFFNNFSGVPGEASYEAAFEEKYARLKAKFMQLYDAGVRKFSILNDDFGSGSHTEVVRLVNRLDDDLSALGCAPLSYCMQGYNKGWSNSSELTAMKSLNPDIALFWTGDDVNSPITQETVDFVKTNTNHEAIFWLNYPVNEHAKSGLYLGNITHYARDGVMGLAGAVSNPCWFTEANKVGLFQLAALFWNNNNYTEHADEVWEHSFKYLQPEVYESYLTIARNVTNCPNSGRVPNGFPESEYIKDALDAVGAKIQSGRPVSNDPQTQQLIEEFSNIKKAIETFRTDCTNKTLVENLDLWMKSLWDIADAGEAALLSLCALEEKDADAAWKYLSLAGASMATHNTYTYKEPSQGAVTTSLAGSKRLIPFVNKAIAAVKTNLIPFLNPSLDIPPAFYAVLAGTDRGGSQEGMKTLDGNETSYAQFDQNQQKDDYFGLDLGKPIPIQSIEILQASNDTDNDFFHNAVLEYSTDTVSWTPLTEYANDSAPRYILQEGLDISARFIRLRLTKTGTTGGSGTPNKAAYWTHIREIKVNGGFKKDDPYSLYASEGLLGNVTLEGVTYHLREESPVSLESGEYIGIKMKELSGLKDVSLDADNASSLKLQYSVNGAIWTDVPDSLNSETARYVRLYNESDRTVTFTLTDLSVTVFGTGVSLSVADRSPELNTIREGALENLFDGKEDTYVFFESSQKNGHELIIDFGADTPIHDVTITQATGNPKFYNAAFYLSLDRSNWGDPIMTVTESNGVFTSDYRTESNGYIKMSRSDLAGRSARYLKIQVTKDSGYRLKINEIEINKTIDTAEKPIDKIITNSLTGDLNKIIDGDISSVYVSETPSDGTAFIKYPLTENTKLTSVTFLQNASDITNAEVKAEIFDGTNTSEELLGTLGEGSSTFYFSGQKDILSFTVTWPKDAVPALYEIIPTIGENVHKLSFTGDGAPKDVLYCAENRNIRLPENDYQKEGYIFEGWSDGAKIYKPKEIFIMSSSDITLSAVWTKLSSPISSVSVSPTAINLKPKDTKQLSVSVKPDDSLEKTVIWSSSNERVASVNQNGLVTANAEGTAVITASSTEDPEKKGSCTVTVIQDSPLIQESHVYEIGTGAYTVTSLSKQTVAYTALKDASKKTVIPETIKLTDGKTYKVTSIAASAFKNNKNITEVTIGKNIEVIESNAFAGCSKLKNIKINSLKLKEIKSKAFYNCKLLKKITIKSKALKKVGKNTFKGIHKKAVIKVPSSKLKKYKTLLSKKGQKKSVKISK